MVKRTTVTQYNSEKSLDTTVSEFWRFASELSIVEAALLILGVEPQGRAREIERSVTKPEGYVAIRNSLLAALRTSGLEGRVACYEDTFIDENTGYTEQIKNPEICDVQKTFVEVDDLKRWLRHKGHVTGFFFPESGDRATYLDDTDDRYAPKLAAAVEAWLAFDPDGEETGTPKQRMQTWLRLNAVRFGLISDDGKLSEGVIEEIARIANWATSGGAPKTKKPEREPPARQSSEDNDFDDSIPF